MEIKRWVIRFVLGIALANGAGFVVQALHLGLIVVAFGGLDEYLYRKHPREEAWLHFLGMSTMLGGCVGTGLASFLAILIAPIHCTDRALWRAWVMAATLGALAGSGVGGAISLSHPQYISLEWTMILVLTGGAFAGAAAAILLRLRSGRGGS